MVSTDNKRDFNRFIRILLINDILVQLSGSLGVFLLFLILDFYSPSFVLKIVLAATVVIFPVYFAKTLWIVGRLRKNYVSSSEIKNEDIRRIVSKIKVFYFLPETFYISTLFLWIIGGIIFAFVLKFYANESDFFRVIIQVLSIAGLAPIAALISRIITKRVVGTYLVKILNVLSDEIQLNFFSNEFISLRWFFMNIIYVLFYIIFFFSIVSVSVTTKIVKQDFRELADRYIGEITDTIEGYYFSATSPEDLDIYLKTKKITKDSKISFIDKTGKMFGFPLPESISKDDLLITKKVRDYGTLYIYFKVNSFDYFRLILNKGLIFFFVFLIFVGYVFYIQLGKDIEIEHRIINENIEKIASGDFNKLNPLYSNYEFSNLNLKIIEAKKNFASMFSRLNLIVSRINSSISTLLSNFESFSVFTTNQSKNIVSTKSQVMFLDEFVTNITTVTSQLSQIAEEFSHVIVKFVAAINEARNETHNLLKLTDSITSSVTEVSVGQNELENQAEHVLMVSDRLDRSIEKLMDFIRSLSIENSEAIKKSITLQNQNSKNAKYMSDTFNAVEKFKTYFNELLEKVDIQSDEINKINQILRIIEDLIDQTNVLALNASLIAVKTGTENSGFGVIAESIKDLSERLHISMSEVSGIIGRGVGNFQIIQEIGMNSKKSLASVENYLEKSAKLIEENKKQLASLSKSFDLIFVIVEEAKMITGDLIEDLRNVKNFLDSINYDLAEQKRSMDRIFDYAIDLKDIVEVIKVSYEQMSDSTSTFSFTYDKMRNLSGDLNESIGRFRKRLTEILALLNDIDANAVGTKDLVIQIEFTLYNMNKTMVALNSIFSKIKLPFFSHEDEKK